MEILVYLDQTDKDLWYATEQMIAGESNQQKKIDLRTMFWGSMVEKYPVIKNMQVAINPSDGYIYKFNGMSEVNRYSRYV